MCPISTGGGGGGGWPPAPHLREADQQHALRWHARAGLSCHEPPHVRSVAQRVRRIALDVPEPRRGDLDTRALN
jgi:hypothetical protein